MKPSAMPPLFILISTPGPDGATEWRDAMEMGRVAGSSSRELRLALDVPAGYYQGVIRSRRGQFPMESLHLQLQEWPSLKIVPAGPFDFDHTQNTMTVPCFHVQVDDETPELAWCDIPSAEMVEGRFFETAFGFAVGTPGGHRLCLRWREDETRIGWDDVDEIRISADARQSLPCPRRPQAGLWADEARWRRLRERPTPLQQALIEHDERVAASGLDGTYLHRTSMLAMLFRLGRTAWVDELRGRALALMERRDWGFHAGTGELGCDNDRDAGIRLMELSTVLAWAAEAFSPDERRRMTDKIRRHAGILYRFTIVQKAYWPDTSIEAHGLGGWLGLTAAAAVLAPEDAEARVWLDWCYGNFLRNVERLPRDGHNPWPVFNHQWAVYLLALFERLADKPLEIDHPFFSQFAPLLVSLHAMQALPPLTQFQGGHLHEEVAVAGYLAARNGDNNGVTATAQWARTIIAAEGFVPPLALLFLEGTEPRAKTTAPVPRTLRTRNGLVLTRDACGEQLLTLTFTCGSPQGPENAARLNRYNQFHNNMGFGGGYTLAVNGRNLIAGPAGGYDYRTSCYPLISIDGGGHILEHRYGGFCLQPTQQPFIRRVRDSGHLLFIEADLRPGFRADCGLLRMIRRIWLLRGQGIMAVLDDVASDRPHCYVQHLPTPGAFSGGADEGWRVSDGGQSLCVTPLAPADWLAEVAPVAYVPPYSMGLNRYKSRDWQPEVHALRRQPPDFQSLNLWPPAPVAAIQTGVVLSLAPVDVHLTPSGWRVGGVLLDAVGEPNAEQGAL